MRNRWYKLFVIVCGLILITVPLFGIVSCAKKKPPAPVVEKITEDEEMRKAEEARKKAEEEEKRKAEENARLRAEEDARLKAEEDARRKVEEEKKTKAEEAAKAEETAKAEAQEAAKAGEEAKAEEGKSSHEVVKGESLWKIAKYKDVYENPFMWPVIYKANHDKIKDPDLIYPKQVFSIPGDVSSEDEKKAVRHAKTRGEWSLHDGSEKYWEPGYKKK